MREGVEREEGADGLCLGWEEAAGYVSSAWPLPYLPCRKASSCCSCSSDAVTCLQREQKPRQHRGLSRALPWELCVQPPFLSSWHRVLRAEIWPFPPRQAQAGLSPQDRPRLHSCPLHPCSPPCTSKGQLQPLLPGSAGLPSLPGLAPNSNALPVPPKAPGEPCASSAFSR